MTQKVLVVGATGMQGAAVVDHLLSGVHGDFAVTATTRHPYSARHSVASLRDTGANVVKGDLDDPNSYREHLDAVDAAFLVTTIDGGANIEADRGTTFVDEAVAAGLDHVVYASTMGANHEDAIDVEALAGKAEIEAHLRESGLDWTIVRPGVFVQHFESQREEIDDGTLAWPVEPDTHLALVDVDDVGHAVATAFAHPERYAGVAFDLAGDVLTLEEVADGFAEVLGHDVDAVHVTADRERERFGDVTSELYAWYDAKGGFRLDPAPLADRDLEPRSLHQTLLRTDWATDRAIGDEETPLSE